MKMCNSASQACATHPHLLPLQIVGQSPFRTFQRAFQPASMVYDFVDMFEMEIVQQMGMSGKRLVQVALRRRTFSPRSTAS